MSQQNKVSFEDLLGKSLGVVVAIGALAVGIAAAAMNNERSRQMRDEVKTRLDVLGKRVDDLSAQANRALGEHRPEIEQTIQKGREAVVQGLDKARTVVEQGAERAQTYVNRTADNAGTYSNGNGGASAGSMSDAGMNDSSNGTSNYGES
jgi:ABC-type transporter Mla subunit MlaD